MRIEFKRKERAITLRNRGFSFREISESLNISKSTASLWLRHIKLSPTAKKRIKYLGISGREKANKTNGQRRLAENNEIAKKVKSYLSNFNFSKNYCRIACALLYWCEGGKLDGCRVSFINSDPEMVKYFLKVFRKSFKINESKFRILMHLHNYHNPVVQTKYWSKITGIPLNQFSKPFLKNNSGKVKRKNYPGCVSIRYYDGRIKKEIISIYKTLIKKYAGVG